MYLCFVFRTATESSFNASLCTSQTEEEEAENKGEEEEKPESEKEALPLKREPEGHADAITSPFCQRILRKCSDKASERGNSSKSVTLRI